MMHKLLLIFACALMSVCVLAQGQQLTAFPGAEGYGKFTTGGRGGVVYHVTRLDDCTDANLVEGTLRWALRTGDDTPRTIVFDTCGTIVLTSKLKLEHPNVTLAGQSAPGGGICVAGACIYVCKPNVIIRYLRFRPGDIMQGKFQSLDVENTRNVIIDHCSLTWAVEECLTMYDCDSTTVQWTIIGEGFYSAGHAKGSRSYATQWGGEHATMHHCLITNCHNRTPRFNGVRSEAHLDQGKHDHDAMVDNEFVNNVIFNWGKPNSVYGGENDTTINKDAFGQPIGYDHIYMINNYFRPGPATQAIDISTRYFVQGSKQKDYGRWYLSGNKFEIGSKWRPATSSAWRDENLQIVNDSNMAGYLEGRSYRGFNLDGVAIPKQETIDRYVLAEQYASSELQIESADEAFLSVTQQAGASLPRYDEEDTRLLAEVAGEVDPCYVGATQPKWLGIIDSQKDITFQTVDSVPGKGGNYAYPSLACHPGDTLPTDTDRDGMPDYWELAHGLDPNSAADGVLCTLSSLNAGYTNLEYYLNGGDGQLSNPIPAARPVPAYGTALDDLKLMPEADIVMQNGTIYVIKAGEKYTLAGQKAE